MNQEAFLNLLEHAQTIDSLDYDNVDNLIIAASNRVYRTNLRRGADNVVFASTFRHDPFRHDSNPSRFRMWLDDSGLLKENEMLVVYAEDYLETGVIPPRLMMYVKYESHGDINVMPTIEMLMDKSAIPMLKSGLRVQMKFASPAIF